MTSCIIAFIAAFLVGLVTTRVARPLALRVGAVDRPDRFRKLHEGNVPRLGGVAIFLAFLAPLAGLFFLNPYLFHHVFAQHQREAWGVVLGGGAALGIGVFDDLRGLTPRAKLLWQLAPATIAFLMGSNIGALSLPFLGYVNLGRLSLPVTLLWFLSCMNAVNLLDGLDGLAAGVVLFVSLTLFLVGLMFHNVFSMVLMACLSGAVLGFLVFNFHPARIFLGDSGSMLLGFLVASLSLIASRKAETAVALLIPIVALGLPIMDTSLAILRRWYKRLPLEEADRHHIHHSLIALGWSHRRVVVTLYFVSVALGLSAVLITFQRSELTLIVLGVLVLLAFVCARVFAPLKMGDMVARVTRDREVRRLEGAAAMAVERALEGMPHAPNIETLWALCADSFQALALDFAQLHLPGEPPLTLTWTRNDAQEWNREPAMKDYWSARLSLHNNGDRLGHLEVYKLVSNEHLYPRTPMLADRLRSALASRLGTLMEETRRASSITHAGSLVTGPAS